MIDRCSNRPQSAGPRSGIAKLGIAVLLAGLVQVIAVPDVGAEPPDNACVEGSSCFSTIQAAVDAASAGGTVTVNAGTYDEDVVTNGKVMNFLGDGTPVIRGSITFGATAGTAMDLTGSSSVSGFAFQRPSDVEATVAMYKMVAANGSGHDVAISDSTFDLQAGATETPTPGRGAALSGTARWTVTGNLFANQEYGSVYESRTLFFENAGRSVIHDNEFVMPSAPQGQAVFLTGAGPSGSQITSNRFSGGLAIALGIPEGVLIRGNDFEGGTRVRPEDSPGAVIRNNRFTSAVFFAVGTTNIADFTENDISFTGFPPTASETFRGKTVFNGAEGVTLDARLNWWGSADEPTTIAMLDVYDNPVIVEPRITTFTAGIAPSGFRSDRGFWPTNINPQPTSQASASTFVRASDGTVPTVVPGAVTVITAAGDEVESQVSIVDAPAGEGAVVVTASGLTVTVSGDRGATEALGAIVVSGGEFDVDISSAIDADIPAGSVVEIWLFSTPRLVAAARADVDGQVDAVPLSTPLDGGEPIPAGAHTLQLIIPTTSGTRAVNVGVTVVQVPTSVPSGVSPSSYPPALPVALLIASSALGLVALRRHSSVAPVR